MSDGRAPETITASDGTILLQHAKALPILDYHDHVRYSRGDLAMVIVWLLPAIASGVVGNLAYDAMKRLVGKATELHRRFVDGLPERSQTTRGVSPKSDLGKVLKRVAWQAIETRNQLLSKRLRSKRLSCRIDLLKGLRWAVEFVEQPGFIAALRELRRGAHVPRRWVRVEIDLEPSEDDGFPVRIYDSEDQVERR